ncbi:MAG: hypothetical protein ACJ73V_12280 [Acidimicrobiia bacterium]
MTREAGWRPEDDPEYMAEMQRAMQSVSWGCVLFIVGMVLQRSPCSFSEVLSSRSGR